MARKSIFSRAMPALLGSEDQPDSEYRYNPSGLNPQMNALVQKVRDWSRWPLHEMNAQERKREAHFTSELKRWVRKLSGNDRAIVMQRQPWGNANHIMGINPIDSVVASGRGASYERAPKPGFGKRGLDDLVQGRAVTAWVRYFQLRLDVS
ncbi:hypothetical protein [Rhizobium leguminosarum]|uniref:hypothetical protein n=1 Tax=Rhizobium leguminosarum TaxID=384 RepID=UPI00103054DD|nr:hypothetical protein [Rhizobium leguminosarum]TBG52555.1 hypothetical protein ELG74_36265 [Rhizobium leguminosarum]